MQTHIYDLGPDSRHFFLALRMSKTFTTEPTREKNKHLASACWWLMERGSFIFTVRNNLSIAGICKTLSVHKYVYLEWLLFMVLESITACVFDARIHRISARLDRLSLTNSQEMGAHSYTSLVSLVWIGNRGNDVQFIYIYMRIYMVRAYFRISTSHAWPFGKWLESKNLYPGQYFRAHAIQSGTI